MKEELECVTTAVKLCDAKIKRIENQVREPNKKALHQEPIIYIILRFINKLTNYLPNSMELSTTREATRS
jgi:hypothetical protein